MNPWRSGQRAVLILMFPLVGKLIWPYLGVSILLYGDADVASSILAGFMFLAVLLALD